jgi:hypothetical protein
MGKILEISLPSPGVKEKIKEAATARGCTASKYLLSLFEEASRPPRPSNGPELEQLRTELNGLQTTLEAKDLLLRQRDAELRALRGAAFARPSWGAHIDPDLLKALRAGPIHDHRLLDLLGADTPEAMRAISRQLQILESEGLISRGTHGWSWKK